VKLTSLLCVQYLGSSLTLLYASIHAEFQYELPVETELAVAENPQFWYLCLATDHSSAMGNSTSTEHPQTSFYSDNDQSASFPGVRSNPYDSPPSVNVTEPNGSTSDNRDINYSDPYLHNQARRLKQGIESDQSSPFVGSPLSLPDEDRFRSDFNSRRNTGGPNTPTAADRLSDRLESIDIDQQGNKPYPRPTGDSRKPIAGSHHRSDSVKGPYYRARGNSVGREYESGADEDDSRIRRRTSNLALEVSDRGRYS
jgi:hypothetical protein